MSKSHSVNSEATVLGAFHSTDLVGGAVGGFRSDEDEDGPELLVFSAGLVATETEFRSEDDAEVPEFLVKGPEASELRVTRICLFVPSVASSVEGLGPVRLLSMLVPAGLPTSPTLSATMPSSELLPESDIVSSKGRISFTDEFSCSSCTMSLIGE